MTPAGRSAPGGEADEIGAKADVGPRTSAFGGGADVPATWPDSLLVAEAVEELLKKPFSAKIGEHCQIAEFLSH